MWDYEPYDPWSNKEDRYYDPFDSLHNSKYNHVNDDSLKKLKNEINDEKYQKRIDIEMFIFELIFCFIFSFLLTVEICAYIWLFMVIGG